jgi:hypothetical protein
MRVRTRYLFVGVAATIVATGVIVSGVAYMQVFVPFVPIQARGPNWQFEEHPELLTPNLSRAFAEVANSYGYEVRTASDGSPLIRRSLRNNQEMLWNLTTKAADRSGLVAATSHSPSTPRPQP